MRYKRHCVCFEYAQLANQNAGNPKDKGNDLGLVSIQKVVALAMKI